MICIFVGFTFFSKIIEGFFSISFAVHLYISLAVMTGTLKESGRLYSHSCASWRYS